MIPMRRKLIWVVVCIAIFAAGWAVRQHVTAVKPGWPSVKYDYEPVRRLKPGDTPYSRAVLAPTYAERRRLYLSWAARQPTPDERGGVMADLLKLETGAIETVSPGALNDALQFVNARRDPADFSVAYLIRLYALHHGDGSMTPAQTDSVRKTLLDYRYSMDEPGRSETIMWTENHQILGHGSDYLAGQMFPDAIFTNDGRTGREHRDKARAAVLRWMNYHARTGMAEWDSIPYYVMDLAALLNLAEFADDPEIQVRATMMVDMLLLDAAVNSYY